jgi:hypothetical protein
MLYNKVCKSRLLCSWSVHNRCTVFMLAPRCFTRRLLCVGSHGLTRTLVQVTYLKTEMCVMIYVKVMLFPLFFRPNVGMLLPCVEIVIH